MRDETQHTIGHDQRHTPSPSPVSYLHLALFVFPLLTFDLFQGLEEPFQELVTFLGDQTAVSSYIQSLGAWGPLVLGLIQIVQVLIAVIPGHVFLIATGYVYGFGGGLLLNYLFVVTASQIAFMLARWLGRPFIERLISPTLLERWYDIGKRQGFLFFTIAFVLPVFPTDLMNFVGGLSGITERKFLAANMLGRLPGAVMLTLIGSHGLELSRTTWALLGVLVVALYVGGRYLMLQIERKYHSRTVR